MGEKKAAALLFAACIILLLLVRARYSAPSCPGCNVLMITLDVLPASHLGTYGYSRNTTPNIDAFAAKSWLFEKAVSPTHITFDSDASILLGRPIKKARLGALAMSAPNYFMERAGLAGDLMLPEFLLRKGYYTFRRSCVDWAFPRGLGGDFQERVIGDCFVPGASEWEGLDEAAPAEISRLPRPFFAFYNSFYLHDPYDDGNVTPFFYPEYPGRLRNATLDFMRSYVANGVYYGTDTGNESWELSAEDLAWIVSRYDDKLRREDEAVGKILGFLNESGRLGDTIVVITSEHGEELGASLVHQSFGHGGLSAQTVHVPLIIRVPGAKPRRIGSLVQTTDIYGFLASVLGFEPPRGVSKTALLSGREYAFSFEGRDSGKGGSVITADGLKVQRAVEGNLIVSRVDFGTDEEIPSDERAPAWLIAAVDREIAKSS